MKLRRIEIQGFKSFRFKTGVEIADGVTAIVGPNGCGKSNVVDALRWALGSQSPKDLRGRSMEDVIFAGSRDYKPHGFAEVTLSFENDRGLVPAEWRAESMIRVTRRLFRSGDSEYLVNDVRVRLQDVQSIFLGTGVGSREAYSIIEQGRIGFVVSARPAERRSIIEEAAGITRYKHQRKTAGRRLEQTQENLRRVGDVIDEVERQLTSLERQAKRAARARELQERRRQLEVAAALYRIREARQRLGAIEREHTEAETTLAARTRALSAVDARMEAAKVQAAVAEREDAEATEEAYRARARVELLKNNVHHQERELADLQQRVAQGRAELQVLEATVDNERAERTRLTDAIRETKAERATLEDDLELLAADVAEARERLAETRGALAALDQALAQLQGERARARAEREAAEAERARLERRREQLARRSAEARTRFDALQTHAEEAAREVQVTQARSEAAQQTQRAAHETARQTEAAADLAAQAHREARERVRRQSAKVDTLESLVRAGQGYGDGVKRLLRAVERSAAGDDALRRVGRPVAERIRADASAAHAIALVWGGWMEAVVAEDLEAARAAVAWAREANVGLRVVVAEDAFVGEVAGWCRIVEPLPRAFVDRLEAVTRVGDVLDAASAPAMDTRSTVMGAPGFYEVRAPESNASEAIVTLMGERDEARHALTEDERALVAARHAFGEASEAREIAADALSEASLAVEATEKAAKRARHALLDHEAGLKRERQIVEQADQDHLELEQRMTRHTEQAERAAVLLAEAERALDGRGSERQALSARTELYLVDAQVRADELAELRARHAAADERLKGLESASQRAASASANATERRAVVSRELVGLAARIEETTEALGSDQDALTEAVEAARETEVRYQHTQAAHREATSQVWAIESEHQSARRAVDRAHDVVQRHALEREGAKADLTHALAMLTEELGLTVPEARAQTQGQVFDEQTRAELESVRRRIEALGPVNPAAEEEFAEATARHTFLLSQREDLLTAIRDLESAIRKMDRTSRERFASTFEAVNARFQVLFTRLFEGGQGRLELTEPEDMLNTGVEIVVQPPGKRLQSMQLMSGGEKAMTAVALVFAIFQLKPTPFCLLDEVDAPLDDANVGRFTDMVREMSDESQFIIITHNRATMESAHTLYGVTMEEPGVSKVVGVRLQADPAAAG